MHRIIGQAGLAALTVLSLGCGRRNEVETPVPVVEQSAPTEISYSPVSVEKIPETVLDNSGRATLEDRIFFGFDQSDLDAAARQKLVEKVEVLRASPSLMLRVEGHADERGSDEYNLALSTRRAAAAKRFLVNHGISGERLETVGYGEEQPLDTGDNEAGWGRNRRDDFKVSSGPLAQQ